MVINMTNKELLREILILMEINFGEHYFDYDKEVAQIEFNDEIFNIFKKDVEIFNELKTKLEVFDILSNNVEEMTGLKDFGLPLNKKEDNPYRIQSYKIFKEDEFIYLETYKGYNIFRASLNPHNSEYIIHELGFDTRWSSLNYCKKYIREQLK